MNRTRVISKNLKSVGHEPLSATLEVEFLDGKVYQYDNVPASIFKSLLQAASKGTYFAKEIKNKYTSKRIE